MSKFMTKNDLNKFTNKLSSLAVKIDQVSDATRKIGQDIHDRRLSVFDKQEGTQEEIIRERERLMLMCNSMPVIDNLCESICQILESIMYQLECRHDELDRLSKKKS